jgi:hypothetical protein
MVAFGVDERDDDRFIDKLGWKRRCCLRENNAIRSDIINRCLEQIVILHDLVVNNIYGKARLDWHNAPGKGLALSILNTTYRLFSQAGGISLSIYNESFIICQRVTGSLSAGRH